MRPWGGQVCVGAAVMAGSDGEQCVGAKVCSRVAAVCVSGDAAAAAAAVAGGGSCAHVQSSHVKWLGGSACRWV
jgi:hypothetical protein